MILGIDIETYSEVDLPKCGLYRYVEDPSFEILLISYCVDDEPVKTIDMHSETAWMILLGLCEMLQNPEITKSAYNAQFEITCLSKYFGVELDPAQWIDTMIMAAYVGLPMGLDACCTALRLSTETAKDKSGKDLIRYFSKPCKPTRTNGNRTRNLPSDAPDKWKQYKYYNAQDVVAEREIRRRLTAYGPGEKEHEAWVLDQQINRRGVLLDMGMVRSVIRINEDYQKKLTDEAVKISGIDNPNSVSQLKSYLGVEGSLNKKTVAKMRGEVDGDKRRMLEIRAEMGKSSIAKYTAMENCVCRDGRARGLFQFYGTRTGRWAGRLIQLQNLPQNHLEDLGTARRIAASGDGELLEMLYGNVPDTLSQLLRTALIPKPGCKFAVADFSAIEARVVAWLAGEEWRAKVFEEGGDIYCASASQMFGVPVVKHGINGHLRQKGKIAELALGYGGSVGALEQMGALDMGLQEEELQPLVTAWRESNPRIVALWWDVDKAVHTAVRERKTVKLHHGVEISCSTALLSIRLPSGRCIRYFKPCEQENDRGQLNIEYRTYEKRNVKKVLCYGPKFVENIVQAIARDCLVEAMMQVSKHCDIVAHVHDEMICEVPADNAEKLLSYMCDCMAAPIPWAPGLLLRGDGYLCDYYRKD